MDVLPVQMLEVDIAKRLLSVDPTLGSDGISCTRGLCLVKLGRRPLGQIPLDFCENGLSADELAKAIWQALGPTIQDVLQESNGTRIDQLTADGIYLEVEEGVVLKPVSRHFEQNVLVSVIVPTHNRPAALKICLDALLRQTYQAIEIIVVDNAPADDSTCRMIQEQYSTVLVPVHYVLEPFPNASLARNRGLEQAKGEITAFLDDDSFPDENWVAEIVDTFADDEKLGCVTGLILPTELNSAAALIFQNLWEYDGFGRGFNYRTFDLNDNRPDDPLYPFRPSIFGTGGNMAFRKTALSGIDGFDTALGPATPTHSAEELDVFFRLLQADYRIAYQPSALVRHPNPSTLESVYNHVYSFGVGYTAFLTKCLVNCPLSILEIIPRIPYGIYFALSRRSSRNCNSGSGETIKSIRTLERKGLMMGPWAYLVSRWSVSRQLKATIIQCT